MNKLFPITLVALLALAACAPKETVSDAQKHLLENPLYAERYYKELVDRMVGIQINEAAALKSGSSYASLVETTKNRAFERAKLETQKHENGLSGTFVQVKEQPEGQVLLYQSSLYFGTDFVSDPGPSVHVYLSKVVDPRNQTFPDPSALDLGLVDNAYGAQEYNVLTKEDLTKFQTVTLYDPRLKRIHGFVQLGKE